MDRLLRSTSVPIADRPVPMIRSPSQCPGTARSAASAGRSLITTSAVTCPCGLFRDRARGSRSARPVRRHATSSRLSAPRPCDEQRLVDRLVADAHGLIIGELDPEPVLICSGLHAVAHRRSCRCGLFSPFHAGVFGPATIVPSGRRTLPDEPLLHVLTQPVVARELRGLRALGGLLGLPLRHHGAVVLLPAPGRRVAAQLARDRPRVTAEPAGDLPHARRPGRAAARSPHARRTTGTGPWARPG